MNIQYDLAIIGSGPAGLTSAIYAQRALLKTIVIEKNPMSGGQILNTYEVDNYPGLPMINGFDLGIKMREHADKLGTEFLTASVKKVEKTENGFTVLFDGKEPIEAKTVIIATGAEHVTLGVSGEEELKGMGVSYCATCDGAFFRGKIVAVVGGGDVALEDAIFLARGCEKVYVIHRRDEFRGAKILQQQLLSLPNVEVIWDSVVEKIEGEGVVNNIKVRNVKTEEQSELPVQGVFVAVGNRPDTDMVKDIVDRDEKGYIIGDETGTTSTAGLFVAGDVRTKALSQVVTAASDGANAVYSIEKYLAEQVK